MGDVEIGLVSILFVLVTVYIGIHVGVALSLISFIGVWIIQGDVTIAGKLLALAAAESLQRYEFGVIPLFVLMGLFVSVSDIGRDTYDVANHVFRKIKGGLGTATVAANAIFAAVTGTSIASASVFTKVAVPEMLRLGYRPRFAVGVVAGSSVLGMLIPPSLLLILYGILAETSIGDLFIAGILPGILLAVAFGLMISLMANRWPDYVQPNMEERMAEARHAEMSWLRIFLKLLPIFLLIALVMGGIYGGVFTATEAGGVGALGGFVLTLIRRKLTLSNLWRVLVETGHVTAAISFLLISAYLYGRMITISGIPTEMEEFIVGSGLSFATLMVFYIAILVVLGTIMSAGEIMLIMVPLAVPAMGVFEVDLVWLGIVTVIGVEIGLLTPPLGLACFVIHNNLQDKRITVNDIFYGAAPFAVTMLVVLILVTVFPQIALFLVF
jgi:C4-dicarboxylate transporter, DctM subunit